MNENELQDTLSFIDPIINGYALIDAADNVWAYSPELNMAERLTKTRRAIEVAMLTNANLPTSYQLRTSDAPARS